MATLRQILSKYAVSDLRELLSHYKIKNQGGDRPDLMKRLLTYYDDMSPEKAVKEVNYMFGEKPTDILKLVDSRVRPRARPNSGTDKRPPAKKRTDKPRIPRPRPRPDSNTDKPSVPRPLPRPDSGTDKRPPAKKRTDKPSVPRPRPRPDSGTDKRPPAKQQNTPKKSNNSSRKRSSETIADRMTARALELRKQGKSNKEATEIIRKERAAGKFKKG